MIRTAIRTGGWTVLVAAGMLAGARPAAAQRRVTFVPVPFSIVNGFWVSPGARINFGYSTSSNNGPFTITNGITTGVPNPLQGGGFGVGAGGGTGGNQGDASGSRSGSGEYKRTRKERAPEPPPPDPNDVKDEGRLAGMIGARLLRIEGDTVILRVMTDRPILGREAWVDVVTGSTRLSASQRLSRLGTVVKAGSEPNTYVARVLSPARTDSLVEAMPVWLLLPAPPDAGKSSGDAGPDKGSSP